MNSGVIYNTFIPNVCIITGWRRSGGVVTVPGGEMEEVSGEVSGGLRLKDEGDGY